MQHPSFSSHQQRHHCCLLRLRRAGTQKLDPCPTAACGLLEEQRPRVDGQVSFCHRISRPWHPTPRKGQMMSRQASISGLWTGATLAQRIIALLCQGLANQSEMRQKREWCRIHQAARSCPALAEGYGRSCPMRETGLREQTPFGWLMIQG
ncbi:MAG: hypothetical protein AAF702_05030 [Chloroflexota bacterium]